MTVPVIASESEQKEGSFTATTTITAPAGIVDDDILIAMICTDRTSGIVAPPTGFTPLTPTDGLIGVTNSCTLYVAWKRAASESGDYTFNWVSNRQVYAFMLRISDVLTTEDPENLGEVENQAANLTPSIDPTTPSLPEALVLCFFTANDDDITEDGGFDADYVGITSDSSSTGNNTCSGCIQTRDEATPGDPPECTWTLTVAREFAILAIGLTGPAAAGFSQGVIIE
jgi:hypothetical protein